MEEISLMLKKMSELVKEFARSIEILNGLEVENKNLPQRLFLRSSFRVVVFYLLVLAIFFYPAKYYKLETVFSIILLGNFCIAIITQIFHYYSENNDGKNCFDKFSYQNFEDCCVRCSAGISEMIFYTISFAINADFLIAGYLIMKSLSIWQNKDDPVKEGRHTSVHRIGVVLSLIISLWASYFLFIYLQKYQIFNLTNHFLFK